MSNYKMGLKPVTTQPLFRLRDYFTSDLPSVDSLKFPLGNPGLIQPLMLMNNILGCCASSATIEEIRFINAARGVTVPFTDLTVVQNYSECTGYRPGPEILSFNPDGSAIIDTDAPPNPTDEGTDVHELFDFRQKTGFIDANGQRHKIIARAGLTPGDWDEMLIALSLFEVVNVGVQLTARAEQQFGAGLPWHLLPGDNTIIGGHDIPIVGAPDRNTGALYTWGGNGGIDSAFYSARSNVAVVSFTEEMLVGDKTPTGIDGVKLLDDYLRALNTGQIP